MGKRKGWFSCVKGFLIPEPKPKKSEEQKSKKWRWLLHRFRFRQYHPSLTAPEKTLDEATEERRNRALALAAATAAAAEAAVAAANAAEEVVRLTSVLPSQIQTKNHFLAAVRIQCAYRGHLARKALSALKGLVKLQAVVRGELARLRVFKALSPMSLLQPETTTHVQRKRASTLLDHLNQCERLHSFKKNERIKSEEGRLHSHSHSQRSWDLSLVSKEDMEALQLQKQESIAKRQRMKQYSFSYRERRNDHSLQEPIISHKENRKSSRFGQLIELESVKYKDEKPKHPSRSNTTLLDASQLAQLRLRASCPKEKTMELFNTQFSQPRRSFCQAKEKSSVSGDDRSLPNSPAFPTYMASTESTRARCRSLSTPNQRLRLCDTYSSDFSPHKLGLSSWSPFNSDF